MKTTLNIRLSGEVGGFETVEGYEINGFFVHHPISGTDYRRQLWAISHSQSGQSLLAEFAKLKDAKACAAAIAENYNGHTDANGLLQQFKYRGEKPSVSDLAQRFGMVGL